MAGLHRVPQGSGHTLHAPHIEAAVRPFSVSFFSPAYLNVLHFQAGYPWARILAQTPGGALRVARSHHSRGRHFRLLDLPPCGSRPTVA